MAVYTDIGEAELAAFLADYSLPALRGYRGIEEGVENSNFLVETEGGRYVLTLFEQRTSGADLPFFRDLMAHLADKGIPCPRPVAPKKPGEAAMLAGKPALLVSFLEGEQKTRPSGEEARALGRMLASLHLAAGDFPRSRANSMGPAAWRAMADKIAAGVASGDAGESAPDPLALVGAELAYLEAHWPRNLPQGIIHADLFPDNVLWSKGTISGVIDFYFACGDALAYDLAVTLNAWCFGASGEFDGESAEAIVAGYEEIRPLRGEEKAAMPVLLRGAALRFLLSRTHDRMFGAANALVTPRDPQEYLHILDFHRRPGGAAGNRGNEKS